jgi:hypothetical protein
MRVAITFRDQPECKRCDDEHSYSSFSRREAEPLPHFIEFETTTLLNHELLWGVLCVYNLSDVTIPDSRPQIPIAQAAS